jgi:hypothetical protein
VNRDLSEFLGTADLTSRVGSFVVGSPTNGREVVRWADQFRDFHELAEHVDPRREAYLSLYSYPLSDYGPHYVRAGRSPRGYLGPAACPYLLFDLDRGADLASALADARTLVRFLLARYGANVDDGLAAYFSGAKGFHVLLELLPAAAPTANVPGTCKRLALAVAAMAGVRIDTGCYDHQRLVRLPNSHHPRSGLHKRFLTHEELLTLGVEEVVALARHPAGCTVPRSGEFIQELQDDFDEASDAAPPSEQRQPGTDHPVVPAFVRDFIGFGDVQDPGRAVTLFRCAAALAEAGTPEAVVAGLLEEPALKSGLEHREVVRQIRTGVAHGRAAKGAS